MKIPPPNVGRLKDDTTGMDYKGSPRCPRDIAGQSGDRPNVSMNRTQLFWPLPVTASTSKTIMYEAEIHLQQDKHCILSDLSDEFDTTFDVKIEELHNGDVTFILDSGTRTDDCLDRLAGASSVKHHERIDDERVLVTKTSCCAYSAVVKNHGTLRRSNRVSNHHRVYNVLATSRENLRSILRDFQNIGTVTLGRLEEVGGSEAKLTARQLEVVQHALDNGYYEWPREDTSAELANEMGISRPTFLEHLRKAESKLLSHAVEGELERH